MKEGFMHPIVHQIAKDAAADITIWAPLVGLPTGIYAMTRGDYLVGGTIIAASLLIFGLAFWTCAYYHKRDVHFSMIGTVVGLIVAAVALYAMAQHTENTVLFLKIAVIVLTACAHCATEVHSAFWAQKAMIVIGLLSVAFLGTQTALAVSIIVIIAIFFVSLKLHADAQPDTVRAA